MTDKRTETYPVVVHNAKRRGNAQLAWAFSARDKYPWAEPAVWTERMLAALDTGVKGGRWHSLMDKVYAERNLRVSIDRVKRNARGAGVDHVTVKHFEKQAESHLQRLHQSLKDGTYRPQAVKRCWIPKPGKHEKRPLGVPTVRDRVAQTALRNALEPIFERDFAEHSYGFRPGRNAKDALRRVQHLLNEGYHYVVDADLKGYFDSIPHDRLMTLIRARIADGRVLKLVQRYLEQDILDAMERWTPQEGTPQGAVISPLLSNIYLDPLDHVMAQKGFEMVRYADDFVIVCRTAEQAQQALGAVQAWVNEAGLALHPDKTHVVDASGAGGFDFLGYHFERGMRWPSNKAVQKMHSAIRPKTKRTNGHSLEYIIADINPILRGWFEYFKHSKSTTFRPIDGWVRMRLRSTLRKRNKRKGRARGNDHLRWPNAYFTKHGLFTLEQAYAQICQSSRR